MLVVVRPRKYGRTERCHWWMLREDAGSVAWQRYARIRTHNGRLWVWGRNGMGPGERTTHPGCVSQSPQTKGRSAMCDNCNPPEHQDCTGGVILAGRSSRNGEPAPVCGQNAGARLAADSVLRAEVPYPGMLGEFDSAWLADGNADRKASARRRSHVRG